MASSELVPTKIGITTRSVLARVNRVNGWDKDTELEDSVGMKVLTLL